MLHSSIYSRKLPQLPTFTSRYFSNTSIAVDCGIENKHYTYHFHSDSGR